MGWILNYPHKCFYGTTSNKLEIWVENTISPIKLSMQTIINDQNKHPPQLPLATDSVVDFIRISVQDVNDVLKNLDVKKACGLGHINPRFLKEGAHILSQRLSVLFNRSLSQGYFPSRWKDGYLTPIHTKR